MYCYLEFKPCYLKNLKLFSIRVKELFGPIVLRRKADGFLLFLKTFSWETVHFGACLVCSVYFVCLCVKCIFVSLC